MKTCKRIFTGFLALTLCLTVGISALAAATAYEIPDMSLRLNIPEGSYIFTPDTADDDAAWAEAKIDDPVKYKTEYTEMGVRAHLSTNGGKTNVYIGKKETDTTKTYFSLAAMTDAEMTEFITPYNADENGTTSTGVFYSHPQAPFVKVDISSKMVTVEKESMMYEQLFFTIINGYTVSLSAHSTEPITPDTAAYLQELVDSIHFTEIIPVPTMSPQDLTRSIFYLAVVVLMIVILILVAVFAKVRRTRKKNDLKVLADKLAIYRKEKSQSSSAPTEILFENITEHSDLAIRIFSVYQAYLKNPISPIISIVITIVGSFVSYWAKAEWWLTLLMVAAAAFCIYKFATSSTSIEKALRKVYANMKSRKARYCFRAGDFSISGMQSMENYPYFQITEVREHKGYIYIYFGDNNTYFVNRASFSKGDAESFLKFLAEKTKKKIK